MNFIKLTLESGKETYVNFEKVSDFAEKNSETEIFFAEEQYYFKVKETPNQILQLIENSSVEFAEEEIKFENIFDICPAGFGLRFKFEGFQGNSFEIYDNFTFKTIKELTCFETPKDCVKKCIEELKNRFGRPL